MPRANSNSADYYSVLGVSPQAEEVVIRAAYKALAQRYHPDKMPPAERDRAGVRMLAVQEAYRVLSDPQQRQAYDRSRQHGSPFEAELPAAQTQDWVTGLDEFAWRALSLYDPSLFARLHQLEQRHPDIGGEYRNLVSELISERFLSKVIYQLVHQSWHDEKVNPFQTVVDIEPKD